MVSVFLQRSAFLLMFMLPNAANAQAMAATTDSEVLRQRGVNSALFRMEHENVAFLRSNCATGSDSEGRISIVAATAASFRLTAAELCVTVLTRSGRDSTLQPLVLTDGSTPPSLSFDTGFVSGYLKHEAAPSGAPSLATLLPVAERCLNQREPNKLCGSVGYMLGLRAASGETISAN